jgi:hypothetical protein
MDEGDRTAGRGQKMARVNVDATEWLEFRVLAMRKGRSIADYLGQFVRRELKRAKRSEPRDAESVADSTRDEPPRGVTKSARPRVRLADVELLSWRTDAGERAGGSGLRGGNPDESADGGEESRRP